MLLRLFIIGNLGFLWGGQTGLAQSNSQGLWSRLLDVKYEYSNEKGYQAQFSSSLKELKGRKVILKGYMYPLDVGDKQKHFMLSYYPIAACFFCGGAGPESIVEIFPKEACTNTQKPLLLQGRLELNDEDPSKMFFILHEAEIIE